MLKGWMLLQAWSNSLASMETQPKAANALQVDISRTGIVSFMMVAEDDADGADD